MQKHNKTQQSDLVKLCLALCDKARGLKDMDVEETQESLRVKAQEIMGSVSKLEKMGMPKTIVEDQIQISNKLHEFSEKITPLVNISRELTNNKEVSERYRNLAQANPRIKRVVFLLLFLLMSSVLIAVAVEESSGFFIVLKDHILLIKSIVLFSLSPLVLTIALLGYKAETFLGRGGKARNEKYKMPIRFWLEIIFWVGLSIFCIYGSWYVLKLYINA